MIAWILVGLVVAFIALVAVLALTGSSDSSFTVNGSMTINSTSIANGAVGCHGAGGYDDLAPGAQVVITGTDNKTIGVGQLDVGGTAAAGKCVLDFTIAKVPTGQKFYGITISHRGAIQYTEQEMKDGPGLTIGDGS